MAWVTIRGATDEDRRRLSKTAHSFAKRHPEIFKIAYGRDDWIRIVEDYLAHESRPEASDWEREHARYLAGLWCACVRRALRSPDATGIAYGYVGHSDKGG